MPSKWKMYKVSGKVSYFVTDIMAPSQERAFEIANATYEDDVHCAAQIGNIELLEEINVELLRPATKDEVTDAFGMDEWED